MLSLSGGHLGYQAVYGYNKSRFRTGEATADVTTSDLTPREDTEENLLKSNSRRQLGDHPCLTQLVEWLKCDTIVLPQDTHTQLKLQNRKPNIHSPSS